VPPVAADDLSHGATDAGHFLVDQDGLEFTVKRNSRLGQTLGGRRILLAIWLIQLKVSECEPCAGTR
jgi:hypothetical protein